MLEKIKNLKKLRTGAAFGLLFVLTLALSGCAQKGETFTRPDIKDDFCGVIINPQYCRCAFHNEYCDVVGLSPASANWYVRSEYRRWVKYLENEFKIKCEASNGWVKGNACYHCEEGDIRDGNNCINPELAEQKEEEAGDKEDEKKECVTDKPDFADNWQKYSDIDNRIPLESRSWEAQNLLKTQEQILALKVENFKLQRDMEIDRQIRLEAREYRNQIAKNQKQNLIKALIRLTYITYTTIDSGSSAGKSFNGFLTGTEVLKRAGGLLATVKSVIPKGSKLEIDTSTVSGKVLSGGLSVGITALENLGDPKEIATSFMTETKNAVVPSADLTPEEIAILRDQHIVKQHIDFAIAESYQVNAERRKQVMANDNQIKQLDAELKAWENKEKQRVFDMLEAECKDQKN